MAFFAGCDDDSAPGPAKAQASARATPQASAAPSAGLAAAPRHAGSAASAVASSELPLPDMPDPAPPPTARPDASGPDANRMIFTGYGFPGYPSLEHLCGRRDFHPGGGTRTWDAFTSSEEPRVLVAHYRKRLGERGFDAKGEGGEWRLPPDSPAPDRTLSIYAVGQPGRHAACNEKVGPEAKSVMVLSRER